MVTDRQLDRQMYAGDSIIPRESFRRYNNGRKVRAYRKKLAYKNKCFIFKILAASNR